MLPKGFTVCPNEWITDLSIRSSLALLLYLTKYCELRGVCDLTYTELAKELGITQREIREQIDALTMAALVYEDEVNGKKLIFRYN